MPIFTTKNVQSILSLWTIKNIQKTDVEIVDGFILKKDKPVAPPSETIKKEYLPCIQTNTLKIKQGRPKKYDGYFLFLNAAGKSKRTIKGYKSDMRFWERFTYAQNKTIYTLKLVEIEKAIAGRDINTVRRLLATLKSLARWYMRDDLPALYIELQKVVLGRGKGRIAKAKDKKTFLIIRDIAKNLAISGDRRGIWLALMLLCGLRISEIQTAEPGDGWVQVLGKGNKERRIPCADWLLKAMQHSIKNGRGGYQLGSSRIDRVLREMGYKKVHSLRHTYATYLINSGVTIDNIKELLGHASIVTTQVYAKSKIQEGICEILER